MLKCSVPYQFLYCADVPVTPSVDLFGWFFFTFSQNNKTSRMQFIIGKIFIRHDEEQRKGNRLIAKN